MSNINGRSVHQTLAFKDHHKRTVAAIDFLRQQKITDGRDLLGTTLETDLISDISKDVSPSVMPALMFPVFVSKEDGVLIDGRSYRDNQGNIRNTDGIGNIATYAAIEYYWNTDISKFKAIEKITPAIYGSWIASVFYDQFGVKFQEQSYLRVLFAFYYWVQFKSEDELKYISKDDLEYHFTDIAVRQYRLPSETAVTLWNMSAMQDIAVFILEEGGTGKIVDLIKLVCKSVPEIVGDPSIRTMDYAALVTLVFDKTWIGVNKRELTMAALEHPPALIMMVAIAIMKKGIYEKTYIGRIVKHLKAFRISGGDVHRVVADVLLDIQDK